ncbi:MAG: cobalt transporter CbiM [Chromatiales bacterium]|jgi:cobalt/nickel transport system permease protein|nr:cobalt transporter CbiM [Chromatiales bacterium]
MHISEGILHGPTLAAGFVGAGLIAAATMRNMDMEEIPKISVITSVFFVASLIKVPIGPSSVHLILNGLAAVVLGWRAFPAILLAIILQAIIFGHGGVTVIGVNAVMLGGGALVAYMVWQQRHRFPNMKRREFVFGALAGATATISSGIVLALALVTTGEAFAGVALAVLAAHIPIMLIEGAVVGACADFLQRVKPEVLAGQSTRADRG